MIKVFGEILFRRATICGINSQCAGTLDISFLVRKCTVNAANFSHNKVFIHSSSSR